MWDPKPWIQSSENSWESKCKTKQNKNPTHIQKNIQKDYT